MIPQPKKSVASPSKIRILIVDDSAVMRSLLRSVILLESELEVSATASDGASALRILDSSSAGQLPHLILLDVEMPIMDGLTTLKHIKVNYPKIAVVMCSSLTHRGAQVTLEALASGAADYVAKPSGQTSRELAIQSLAHDLIPKILALTTVAHTAAVSFAAAKATANSVRRQTNLTCKAIEPRNSPQLNPASGRQSVPDPHESSGSHSPAPFPSGQNPHFQPPSYAKPAIVLIGVSTGGPEALDLLLSALPTAFPLPILIVQHMPALFTKLLADRLNQHCSLRVIEAADEEPILPGTVYLAKGDWHMELTATHPGVGIRLTQAPAENHCRPAVNVLLRSAVEVYGAKVLAVILTGMGSDGLAGCRLIHERGGTILAQDQLTSAIWGMPGAIVEAGIAHRVLPLNQIAPEIVRLTTNLPANHPGSPSSGTAQRSAPTPRPHLRTGL